MSDNDELVRPIREIESAAAAAWPALHTETLAGWRLRYSHGITRRGNSVWPNEIDEGGPEVGIADRLRRVEAFYADRGLPVRYQICPAALPVDLDETLAGRGYAAVAETAVMTAPVSDLLCVLDKPTGWRVVLKDSVAAPWMTVYAAVEDVPKSQVEVRCAIMQAIAVPAAYVTVWSGDEAVAVGSAAWTGAAVGLFNLGTVAVWRRRGAARAAMAALLAWAAERGAGLCYLQVMMRNDAARQLYSRLGMSELYRYHYREQAQTGA